MERLGSGGKCMGMRDDLRSGMESCDIYREHHRENTPAVLLDGNQVRIKNGYRLAV